MRLARLALVVALATGLWAQNGPSAVTARITPAECVVGDTLAYEAEVTRSAADLGQLEVTAPDFAGCQASEAGPPTERAQGDNIVTTYRYTVVPQQTGDLLIAPFSVVWTDPLSGLRRAVSSDRVTLRVRAGYSDDQLRGPKPPVALPTFPWLIWLGVLVALGVAVYAWRVGRRKPKPAPRIIVAPPVAAPTSARDRALAALDALLAEQLPASGRIDEFHVRLSVLLRDFVGEVFGFAADTMATSEIAARLEEGRVPVNDVALSRRTLYGCDREKFAAYTPTVAEMHDLAAAARSMIVGLALGRT